MAPKKRKNVIGSSCSSRFDATLFPSLAKSEAYDVHYATRAVGFERQIDESCHSTEEYGSIMARRWNFLYTFDLDEINVNWVHEFYCNITIQDGHFTFVHRKNIVISPSVLASFIGIEELEEWDYPLAPNQPLDRSLFHVFGMELVGARHSWATCTLAHRVLTSMYRFLNWFYSVNLEPSDHTATINHQHGMALYCIRKEKSVTVPLMIYNVMVKNPSATKNATLPFSVLITRFLISKDVTRRQHDRVCKIQGPINRHSLQQSEAHLTEGDDLDFDEEAEGEQDNILDRLTSLETKVHAMNENMSAQFNTVDESLAAILVRLGHHWCLSLL